MLPLQGFRAKLLAQRRDFFRQAAQTEDDFSGLRRTRNLNLKSRGETETMIRLLDRLDERMKREIEAIDHALMSIEAGSYGRCERCGKDIPDARLQAVPWPATRLACTEADEALKR